MGDCTTRQGQTSGRLVQELNVCIVNFSLDTVRAHFAFGNYDFLTFDIFQGKTERSVSALGLRNFTGLFMCAVVGVVLAIIVALLTILVRALQQSRRDKVKQSLLNSSLLRKWSLSMLFV